MRTPKWLGMLGAAALLVPAGLQAQMSDDNRWAVDLVGGVQTHAESSALLSGATLGIETFYRVNDRFSVGPAVGFVRTETDGTFFIAVLDFGADAFRVYETGQRVTTIQWGANARFDLIPEGKINPYITGGAGLYSLYLSGQSNDALTRLSNPMAQFGGGVDYALSGSSGLRLDVRNMVYLDFDRDNLNPVRENHRNVRPDGTVRVPTAERDLPAAQETIHNLRFSLGFTYIPGASR